MAHFVVPLFLVSFAAMWCGIISLLSRQGGWLALSKEFLDSQPPQGKRFLFASMQIRNGRLPVNYGSCIMAHLGKGGLRLAVLPIFRIMHPPLLIPWHEISEVTPTKIFLFAGYTAKIGRTHSELSFRGELGEAVYVAWYAMNEKTGQESSDSH